MKKNKLRIVMAGGGSGGHAFPIRSLLIHLHKHTTYRSHIDRVFWFGNKKNVEYNARKELNFPVQFVDVRSGKFRRETKRISRRKNLRDIFLIILGLVQNIFLLLRYRIDVVFCKGGHVALPCVIAARILRKKIIVHESDVVPGLTNKIAARFATTIFTGFPNVFPKAHVVGQILSDDILDYKLLEGRVATRPGEKKTHPGEKKKILINCGSLGSLSILQTIKKILDNKKDIIDFHFYIIAGHLNKENATMFEGYKNVTVFPFVTQQEMGRLCKNSDFAICRAGTTSLAEMKLFDLPLIMIPIPWTHDQAKNAQRYAQTYNDIILDQKSDTFVDDLYDSIALINRTRQASSLQQRTDALVGRPIITHTKDMIVQSIMASRT